MGWDLLFRCLRAQPSLLVITVVAVLDESCIFLAKLRLFLLGSSGCGAVATPAWHEPMQPLEGHILLLSSPCSNSAAPSYLLHLQLSAAAGWAGARDWSCWKPTPPKKGGRELSPTISIHMPYNGFNWPCMALLGCFWNQLSLTVCLGFFISRIC